MPTKNKGLLETYFYFGMSVLIASVVVFGFSHTINQNLIHPALARPFILYIHVAVFSSWVIFLILQSALVRINNVPLHRKLGWLGAAIGVAIPVLGISTAIVMGRFKIEHFHETHVTSDLIVQFFDMVAFTIPFALGIYWRKRPEFHRRLILIASCALTSAAFGRFPPQIIPPHLFYTGVDVLIFLGVTYDTLYNRHIHKVYLYGLPALIFGQTIVMYISTHGLSCWSKIARIILS